jgi:ribonuclease HI
MYSINCITKWIGNWLKKDWKTSNGKEVMNRDLIQKLYDLYKKHRVTFTHVRSHTGKQDRLSLGNEMADRLACQATYLEKN